MGTDLDGDPAEKVLSCVVGTLSSKRQEILFYVNIDRVFSCSGRFSTWKFQRCQLLLSGAA